MSRPTKLNPDVQARIVEAIDMGATYELAAQAGGVSIDSFSLWMKKGEDGKTEPYCGFYGAIKESEGRAAVMWLKVIEKAAREGTWQAAAWKLERRYPNQYGRTVVQTEHKVVDEHRLPSDSELARIIASGTTEVKPKRKARVRRKAKGENDE